LAARTESAVRLQGQSYRIVFAAVGHPNTVDDTRSAMTETIAAGIGRALPLTAADHDDPYKAHLFFPSFWKHTSYTIVQYYKGDSQK